MRLGDRDLIGDLLQCQKHLAQGYNLACGEAANRGLREKLEQLWHEVQDLHAHIFHEMHSRGWYKTPTASENQIHAVISAWEKKEHKEPALQR